MHLLQHLVLDDLAPDSLDLVTPIRANGADLEQLARGQEPEHGALHHWCWESFYPHKLLLPREESARDKHLISLRLLI